MRAHQYYRHWLSLPSPLLLLLLLLTLPLLLLPQILRKGCGGSPREGPLSMILFVVVVSGSIGPNIPRLPPEAPEVPESASGEATTAPGSGEAIDMKGATTMAADKVMTRSVFQ